MTTRNYNLTVSGGVDKTFTYDDNGNCATSGSTTYEWDAEDRLVAINNGALRSEFTYDGFSRWVKIVEKNNGTVTSTKQFVWCRKRLCEERDANNTVKKRFYAEGEQRVNSINLFFMRDHLGSVREAVGSGGATRARYDYDPYGRRTKVSSLANDEADLGYTGHYYHAPSGLHLALYRAYDADTGRWLNRDPIKEEGGLNLYAYVGGDPIDLFDLQGKQPRSNLPFVEPEFIETSGDSNEIEEEIVLYRRFEYRL